MTSRLPTRRRIVVALAAAVFAAGATIVATHFGGRAHSSAQVADSATTPTPAGSRPAPIVHRPQGLSTAKPVPLVVALHPSGGTPAGFEANSGLDAVADQHGFVVAYLGSPTRTPAWLRVDISANLAYISSEIKSISASQNIDPTRVFVTGFSAGASMTFFVGCELSAQVAGIAAVSGAMLRSGEPCTLSHPVSELLVIGTNEHIPIGGSAALLSTAEVAAGWRARDGCTAQATSSMSGPVSQSVWTQCNEHSGVGLYIVRNGIHAWPGAPGLSGPDSQYDAARGIWAFFASHAGEHRRRPSRRA